MPDTAPPDHASTAWAAVWLVVAGSAVAALAAHGAIATVHHPLPWTHLPALGLGWLAGRVAPGGGLGAVLGAGAVWPALAAPFGIAPVHLPPSWVGAVLGWVLAQPSRGAWGLPGYWRGPVATWALVVAVTWPIVAARELDFTLASLSSLAANHAGGAPPADTVLLVTSAALAVLTSLLLLNALWPSSTASETTRIAEGAAVPLGLGLAVSVGAGIYQAQVDLAWLNTPYWIGFGRAPGLLGDPNVLGTAAALAGPAIGAAAWRRGGPGRWTAPLWAMVSLAGVLASGSRTALAAWTIGTAGLTIAAVVSARQRVPALLAVAAGVLAVGLWAQSAAMATDSKNPLARAFHALSDADALTVEGIRTALLDRYGYGPVAAAVIAGHPALGVGIGTGDLFLADASGPVLGKQLPADNAQNWWRQVLVELGAIGGAAPIAASLAVLVALVRMARRVGVAPAVANAAPVLGAGLILLVGVPTQHVFLQVVMAWLIVLATAPAGGTLDARPARRPPVVPVAVAVACAVGAPWAVARPPERAFAAGRAYLYGEVRMAEPLPAGTVWVGRRAVGVVPAGPGRFDVAVALPHPDLATSPVDVVISDRRAHRCHHRVTSAAPVTCQLAVGAGESAAMVQVEIARGWIGPDGRERAGLVTTSSVAE